MIRRVSRSVAAVFVTAALGACTMAPRYERPAAPVEPTFPGAAAATAGGSTNAAGAPNGASATPDATPAAEIGWREFFPDSRLQLLIERALINNRDLRVTALNVEAAQAQYRIQRADLVPHIDATGSASSQRIPASLSTTGGSYVARDYSAVLGVTAFELDLFGRVRSLRRSALEEYLSLDETQQSAHLSLVAEVANAWLTLIADRELLNLTRETLKSQQSSLDLTRLRFNSGVLSELDVHQVEIALRTAEVNIAAYTRRVAQDRNALALLVGEALPAGLLGDSEDNVEGKTASQVLAQDLPAGLPGELLERRPDIRAAEHELKARNADIGAARAAFFPRISLTGSYGQAHSDLTGLFDSDQRTWSFAPQITLPIFAGGANVANLDLAQIRKRIGIARYEQAIQSAFREVSDALVARSTLADQLTAQEALTRAASDTYRLSDMRYRGGVESYLNTLIAQRDLYAAQQALIDLRLAQVSNTVSLYKSLGGGWKERR
ncbi:MAG: efflux transporter outer membrane subunit [Gammaproteobacteria bacterium]